MSEVEVRRRLSLLSSEGESRPRMDMRGAAGRRARRAAAGLIGLAVLGASPAWTLECSGRWLSRTDRVICADQQLLRMEEQITRRIKANASRLSLGQYLGVRHWQAVRASDRNACQADRECIVASLRAQARFLDRL